MSDSIPVVVSMPYPFRVLAAIHPDQDRVVRGQDICELLYKVCTAIAAEVADARAQAKHALWHFGELGRLQPLRTVVVRAMQSPDLDILITLRNSCNGPLELPAIEIEGVVVDVLPGVLQRLQYDVDLAEVTTSMYQYAARLIKGRPSGSLGGRAHTRSQAPQ